MALHWPLWPKTGKQKRFQIATDAAYFRGKRTIELGCALAVAEFWETQFIIMG